MVVVLTVCLDDVSVHATKRQAPNYGGRVPVDTTPGPAPVCRALWWLWWLWWVVNGKSLSINSHRMHLTKMAERLAGSQTPGVPATPEPSMTKNSSSSRAHLALNSGTTRRSAKNGRKKRPKQTLIAAIPVPVSCELECPTNSGDELNLWHLHAASPRISAGSEPWALVDHHPASVVAHNEHVNDLVQRVRRAATVGAQLSPPRLHPKTAGPAPQTSTTLSMYCNWRISMVSRTKGNCLCATTEMSTTLTQLECAQSAR